MKFCSPHQNRLQKIFNRGALRLCRGLDILKFDKNSWFIVFVISIWGAWSLVGGLSPPKYLWPLPFRTVSSNAWFPAELDSSTDCVGLISIAQLPQRGNFWAKPGLKFVVYHCWHLFVARLKPGFYLFVIVTPVALCSGSIYDLVVSCVTIHCSIMLIE